MSNPRPAKYRKTNNVQCTYIKRLAKNSFLVIEDYILHHQHTSIHSKHGITLLTCAKMESDFELMQVIEEEEFTLHLRAAKQRIEQQKYTASSQI